MIQLASIATCLGIGIITAWLLSIVLEHKAGLCVSEEDQSVGVDKVVWDLNHEEPTHENQCA